MRTIFLLIFSMSSFCYGQELPSRCDVVMVDYPYIPVLVSTSEDGNFIVRVEQKNKTINPLAFVFEWRDGSYALREKVELRKTFPDKLIVSNAGYFVFIGRKNAESNIDEINIYSKGVTLIKTIETVRLDYSGEPKNCALKKPWICWSHPINLMDETLSILDLEGYEVNIDILSGKYTKLKSMDICK